MDQPERRKRYYLLMGNSQGSSRWGYLVSNFSTFADQVPACSDCVRLIMSTDWNYKTHPICRRCVNWDTSRLSSTIRHTHNNLCTQLNTLNTIVAVKSPSYEELKLVTTSKGMNEAAALKIYGHAQNINLKNSLLSDVESPNDGRFKHEIRDNALRKMHGRMYEPWKGSPLWYSRTHDVSDVIDTPMHLIYLGVVKTTISYVSDFIKTFKISTTFSTIISRRMDIFNHEYKSLSWLKIISFKHGASLETTGWVSENFCSFSRIFLWFISTMTLVTQETTNDEEKEASTPVQSWSRSKLKQFVERYSIDVPLNAKTQLLKVKVKEYFRNNTNIVASPCDPSSQISSSFKHLLLMIQSLHYLTCALMTEDLDPNTREHVRNQIEKYSRLYLSSLHSLAQRLGINNSWVRCWNAQSLLNLGELYERFGSIRNYWEGGMQGEGLVQVLKKKKDILNLNNWPVLILQRLLRKRMFELMKRAQDNPNPSIPQISKKRMSYTYKSVNNFLSYISMRKVLSVLWVQQYQGYYIDVKTSFVGIKLSFIRSDEVGRWFTIGIVMDDQQENLSYDHLNDDAIIFLPSSSENLLYTPVFYSWKLIEYSSNKGLR